MTTTADRQVTAYGDQVRAALADLAPADRDDLLADLDAHLSEVAEETDEPLEARLGPPAAYAAELRAAAGLPPRAATVGPRGPSAARRLTDGALAFLPELLPGWWVVRGVLVAWALAFPALGAGGTFLLALLLVPASVLLGLRIRTDPGLRWAGYTASLASLLLLVLVAGTVSVSSTSTTSYDQAPQVAPAFDSVSNLYPYTKDGAPLSDVQLFDQDGNPVVLTVEQDAAGNSITRVARRTTDGQDVDNVYPQRQTRSVPTADGRTRDEPVQPPTVTPPTLAPN